MHRLILMLPLFVMAACSQADEHVRAKQLIAEHCAACHQVPGVSGANGRVGPSLAGIARQQIIAGHFANAPATLARWIEAPQEMLPGNAMPDMQLSHEQAVEITAYLYTLEQR
jgi:cytochrome c2